jgi:hypothetical protein
MLMERFALSVEGYFAVGGSFWVLYPPPLSGV